MRAFLFGLILLLVPVAASADLSVEGVKLGASKSDVAKLPGAKAGKDQITYAPNATTQVDVSFDAKGKANRIYVAYRKGLFPIKEFSQQYGDPVKREKGGNVKYIFTAKSEGTLTLEKEKGYPGYYVEVVR
jgi:hypothetical protein